MKRIFSLLLCAAMLVTFSACGNQGDKNPVHTASTVLLTDSDGVTDIALADEGVSCDSEDVYTANDIVFYPEGKDFTFGEGGPEDAHSQAEADRHTVVHITAPGVYRLSGSLSAGQVAVDLGEDAKDDPTAVVTLILDGVDITCSVAPAVIFYNVYECGDADEPRSDVDTSAAGANVIIADGSVNNISGAYVARIYKSVELNEAGTEVVDSKKLHKYDGAFYSKMSMNLFGGEAGDGVLNIRASNEGLDSEMHLTIHGGKINISSGNDGINTNEDGVSVTTVNGGELTITVNGSTGEGDGIDSNGWLVINGGTVMASACANSADAGIDSDMGISINGGTVIATGHMLDHIEATGQTFAVFTFATRQRGGSTYTLKNAEGAEVLSCTPANDFSYLVMAHDALTAGDYSLWRGSEQLSGSAGKGMGAMMGGMRPDGGAFGGQTPPGAGERPEHGEGAVPPEGFDFPHGGEDAVPPEGFEAPGAMAPPNGGEMPQGGFGGGRGPGGTQRPGDVAGESSAVFSMSEGANYFMLT